MVVSTSRFAVGLVVLVFCISLKSGNARELANHAIQNDRNSAVLRDLPELEQIFSRHARMLLEEASPLIIERKPDYRTRVDHKGQMRAISDRTRVIAIACVVLVLVALTMCCCLKRKKADRKESSSGLSEAFPCGTSEANSDTWLVKNESDKFDMVDRLHSWGDVSTPAFRTRGDVRRSDDFVILVSILAPPNTSPRPLMQ